MLGALGILLNAVYWVWTIQRLFWGRFSVLHPSYAAQLTDLRAREYVVLVPLLLLSLVLGLFPHLLLGGITESVSALVTQVHAVGQANLDSILP